MFILYVIIIWYDSKALHCIAEYTADDYCTV